MQGCRDVRVLCVDICPTADQYPYNFGSGIPHEVKPVRTLAVLCGYISPTLGE